MLFRRLAFGLLLAASLCKAGVIHLKSRDIQTGTDTTELAIRPIRRLDMERRHILVQFDSPVNGQHLLALQALGAVVTSSLNDHALTISLPESATLMNLDVAWAGILRVTDKLSPLLRASGQGPAYVVEFHPDVAPADAAKIVRDNGLTSLPHANLLSNQMLVLAEQETLADLAAWDEVAYIFPASEDLVSGQPLMPCAGALSNGFTTGQYVKIGNGWTTEGANTLYLSYVFADLTNKVPDYETKSEIERAMKAWSNVTNVKFAEGTDTAAPMTVAIEFGATLNQDPDPFDGPGGALAHTFYPAPPNPEPIAGDMHFDPSEDWHAGTNVDIYTVALHELGHALGLGHTDDPGAIMYPYYRFGSQLSANDIAGVQSMYGAPLVAGTPQAGDTAPTTPGTPAPTVPVTSPTPASPDAPLTLVISSFTGDGQPVTDATALVQGQVANASTSVNVVWQTNFGYSGRATGGASWAASSIPLALGSNWISISASDTGRPNVSRSVEVTRIAAAVPTTTPTGTPGVTGPAPAGSSAPSISITSPQSGFSTSDTTVTVMGTASDAVGVTQVAWQTNSGAAGTAAGTSNWTAAGIPLFLGMNTIVVRAYDAAGLSRWESLTVNRK